MQRRILRFLRDERGSTASEYAILASLIAGVIVAVVTSLGISVSSLFEQAQNALPGSGS